MKLRRLLLQAASWCVILGATSCQSSSEGDPDGQTLPDATPMVRGNEVAGRVHHATGVAGPLTVALFEDLPISGAPVAYLRINEPLYPQRFEIHDVQPGLYELMVVIDVGANNPTIPGSEDVQVEAGQIQISDDNGVWVDVVVP